MGGKKSQALHFGRAPPFSPFSFLASRQQTKSRGDSLPFGAGGLTLKLAYRVSAEHGRLQHAGCIIGTYQNGEREGNKGERQRHGGEQREGTVSKIAGVTADTLDSE